MTPITAPVARTAAVALLTAGTLLAGNAAQAEAAPVRELDAFYSCQEPDVPALRGNARLINYGSAVGTSILASAAWTGKIGGSTYQYHHMWLRDSSVQYGNPSQWGSRARPLNFTTKLVSVYWRMSSWPWGYRSCTIRVGN